ncbi:MAG: GIY-YIG nuclease family protein [Deltaproteobacteria bacterium]|nr:GIY-YIG nuclease family protein [Deltaproteobacteria bacterium]
MNKGTYCLGMRLDKNRRISIGKRPAKDFPRGFYCYVGSGMKNLRQRIDRHLAREKRFRWHIDWFLTHAKILEIKKIESEERLECAFSRELADLAEEPIMKGFGASDCNCVTHLH